MAGQSAHGVPVDGPPAWQEWAGERWYRVKSGHYQNRAGLLLHRAVWADVHGAIPDGHDVHHVDKGKANNRPSNLELLSVAEHRAHHGRERTDEPWRANQSSDAARERAAGMWAGREPRDVACDGPNCDVVFQSTGMRARFHSDRCRAARYRADSRAQHGL